MLQCVEIVVGEDVLTPALGDVLLVSLNVKWDAATAVLEVASQIAQVTRKIRRMNKFQMDVRLALMPNYTDVEMQYFVLVRLKVCCVTGIHWNNQYYPYSVGLLILKVVPDTYQGCNLWLRKY